MFFDRNHSLTSFIVLLGVSLGVAIVFSQHVDDSDEVCLNEGKPGDDQISPHIPTIVLEDYLDGTANKKETIEKMLSNMHQTTLNLYVYQRTLQ